MNPPGPQQGSIQLVLVPLAAGVGYAIFHVFNWDMWRIIVCAGVYRCLLFAGSEVVVSPDGVVLSGPTLVAHFTPQCTYGDLIMVTIPFLWRGRWKLHLVTALLYIAAVSVANVARISIALWLCEQGYQWHLVHDRVDTCVWYPALAVVVMLWIRTASQSRECVVQPKSQRVFERSTTC